MTANEKHLYDALQRIVSYYDALALGYRGPSVDAQAKGRHENTMFGWARKILKEYETISVQTDAGLEGRIVRSKTGRGKPAVKRNENRDAPKPETGHRPNYHHLREQADVKLSH